MGNRGAAKQVNYAFKKSTFNYRMHNKIFLVDEVAAVLGGRAGLHTEAMVFDERVSIIGSYNMDPRSRVWNSEIALLVDDAGFAAEVLEEMARDFTPDAAWHVIFDESGKLVWSGESDGEAVQFSKDPGTSWWTRFVWGVMRIFPLENEL